MKNCIIAALLCIIIVPIVYSANILFFFAGGNLSHKNSVWPWVVELAKKGHNITFLSPHEKALEYHPNITDITSVPLQNLAGQVYLVDRFKGREAGKDHDYSEIASNTCKAVIGNRNTDPVLKRLLRESSFELVVVNAIFGECGYFIAKYFQAKTITYNPSSYLTWFYDVYGVPPETGWIPDLLFTLGEMPLGLKDRIYHTLLEFYWTWERKRLSRTLENIASPLLGIGNIPSLHELENSVSVVLLNAHPSVDFARTLPPLFVDVGGMAMVSPQKKIPTDFKDFLDGSGPSGAVLITFGTTVLLNKVPTRYQAMFFQLINEFPNVNFLMRWSGPMPKFLGAQPTNLLALEYIPQKEILSHPKLRLFITHGGMCEVHEATSGGVPMLVLPLFADNDYNAYRIVSQEVGLSLEIRKMKAESLINAVDTILTDEKYKRNMMKKREMFQDRLVNPVDTAVYWTEFALRHDDTISTLRPQNQHLNVFQRRLIDVFLILELILLVALIAFLYVLKLLVKFIRTVCTRSGRGKLQTRIKRIRRKMKIRKTE